MSSSTKPPMSARSQGSSPFLPATSPGATPGGASDRAQGPASQASSSDEVGAPPVSERSPASIGPLSRRTNTHGLLFRLTERLEARHGGFLISRLIMMTGVKLRDYTATSPDDPIAIGKIVGALRSLLSNDDFDEIQPTLRERS